MIFTSKQVSERTFKQKSNLRQNNQTHAERGNTIIKALSPISKDMDSHEVKLVICISCPYFTLI